MTGSEGGGLLTVTMVVAAACYFLPALLALLRGAANPGAIVVVNLLVGWTVVGWFACLLWGALGQTKAQRAFYARAERAARGGSGR